MASRISQMRNGMSQPTMRPPSQQQAQLNQSIEQMRGIMQQIQNSQNPQMMLQQFLQNNPNTPMIAALLNNGRNLEGIARSMAQMGNIDIQQVIKQLSGGIV